ncbi:glycosyltransferase [Betaproteobacteria bacterium SCN2]|jgi:rSAM/selenodomain-associated transferase 2|nr:glycosyltransferase [Betaproteobacteria bacterium SCN2]
MLSRRPALSIVMPALNEAQHISAPLQALQAFRKEAVEIIVADGGSEDGTAAVAAALADKVIAAPRGRAPQMNAGAAVAAGDALLFLHADTRLPGNACTLIAQALQHNDWGRFNVSIEGRSRWLPLVAGMMNLRSRLSGIATGDQAMFVTRAAFDAVGGFPEQPLMEDIELSRRLKRIGKPACLRETVSTSGRRWDRDGAWRTILLMWRLRFDYWRGEPASRLAQRYYPDA